jgi:hypothetical protein
VVGFEVLYHYKDKSACHRDVLQELLQRLEPAGRGPQTDDQRGSRPTSGYSSSLRMLWRLATHDYTSSRRVDQLAPMTEITAIAPKKPAISNR